MMVSVKRCVSIFVLSLCVSSSIFVDSYKSRSRSRVRKHKRQDSRIINRSSNRYPFLESKSSRLEDCVDCRGRREKERDNESHRQNRKAVFRKPKSRKRKTKSNKNVSENKSSYSIWNIFNAMSDAIWPSGDSKSDDEKERVSKRRMGRRQMRKHSKYNRRRIKSSNSRHVKGKRRKNKKPISRELLTRFQETRKAKRPNDSSKRRGVNNVQSQQEDTHDYSNDYEDGEFYSRRNNRGRNNRERNHGVRRKGVKRDHRRIDKTDRKGSRVTFSKISKTPSRSKNGFKIRGRGKRKQAGKSQTRKQTEYQREEKERAHKKDGQGIRKGLAKPKSKKSFLDKSRQRKGRKRIRKPDQLESYPFIKAEIQKVNEDIGRRKNKNGNGKKKSVRTKASSLQLDRERDSGEEETEQEQKINKGRTSYKKNDIGQRRNRRKKKKTSNHKKKDKVLTKKPSSSKKYTEKNGEKSLKKEKKDSTAEREKVLSLTQDSGDKRSKKKNKTLKNNNKEKDKTINNKKGRRSKKGKIIKASKEGNLIQQNSDKITKSPSNRESKDKKSGQEANKSEILETIIAPKGKKKKGKKRSKSKPGNKTLSGGRRSKVKKDFHASANSLNIAQDTIKSNKSLSRTEAEKQVDALTDEQILYALKVAEKRFKRTDKRIKRKLAALKEMTMQHLAALEFLERSLEFQSLPLKNDNATELNTYHSFLSEPLTNKTSFIPNVDIVSLDKPDLDFKSNAEDFLLFASKSSKNIGTFLPEEEAVFEDKDFVKMRKPLNENVSLSNSRQLVSSSEEVTSNVHKKLSDNDLEKTSNTISKRKQRKQRRKKTKTSSDRKNRKKKMPLKDVSKTKGVTKPDKNVKLEKVKRLKQSSKKTKVDQNEFYAGFTSKSQRGRRPQQGRRPQDGRRSQYRRRPQFGRSPQYGRSSQDGRSPPYGRSSQDERRPQYGRSSQDGRSPPYGRSSQDGRRLPYGRSSQDGRRAQYGRQDGRRTQYGRQDGRRAQNGRSSQDGRRAQDGRRPQYERNSQDGRSSQYGRNSQDGRRPPYGRNSQDGRNNGRTRYEKYQQYLKNRANNWKFQRVLPLVDRQIRMLKQKLRHILSPFTDNLKLSESYYQAIFNTTRYDIISGARDILQSINNANDDVYEAVMASSHLARSIYKRAHQKRAAYRPDILNEEAYDRIIESKVKRRDFRPQLKKFDEYNQQLRSEKKDLQMMEMKSRQLKSRQIQVRERFLENYDHQAFRHLFDNMRSTIDILNNGLRIPYPLTQLHQNKKYIRSIRQDVTSARYHLNNSTVMYHNGMKKYVEIEGLTWKVKKGRRDIYNRRMQSDRPGPGLTSSQYRRLERLSIKAKKHARRLNKELLNFERIIMRAIQNARVKLEGLGKGDVRKNPLEIVVLQLKTGTKDAVFSLDELRQFIGGKTEITLGSFRSCKISNLDNDDEDLECISEGSGSGHGSEEMTFIDSEDDFTFDVDDKLIVSPKINPLRSFGMELKVFTTRMLNTSRHQSKTAHILKQSVQDIKDHWETIEGQATASEQKKTTKKVIVDGLAASSRNSTKIKEKLKQINVKINMLKEIDFDELHAKAESAIKFARKKMNGNENDDDNDDDDEEEEEEDDEDDESTNEETDKVEDNKKTGHFGISDLLNSEESIKSNRDSFKDLQTFAIDTIGRTNDRLNRLRGNITQLWQKVEKAKNILNSMQLSILKEGDSPIISTALSDDMKASESVTTSFSLCIKPQSLDGTVLFSAVNNSVSYVLKLSDGELSASVYDEDDEELTDLTLEEKLEEDKWHTISLHRVGQTLNLTATREGSISFETVKVEDLPLHQLAPSLNYIGGMPENVDIGNGESWKGCVSELLINGKAMNIFNPAVDGNSTSLCSDHCISQGRKLSWIFDGGGFVQYGWSSRNSIQSLALQFRSKQSNAAIVSVADKRRKFHLLVTLENGALQVESASRMESVVLLSLNDSYNDGQIHSLKILYQDRGIYPELDGDGSAFSVENSIPTVLRKIRDGILLGAFVSEDDFINDEHQPLIGCASVLSVNGQPLMYDAMLQTHNVYFGEYTMRSIWQSCIHFSDASQPLSLGEMKDSNIISLLVLRNSTGPVLLYEKEDKYEIELSMTEYGFDVSSADSEAVLIRSDDFHKNELFDLITIEDDGSEVVVRAFGESTKFSYGGWFATGDLSVPHMIDIGQTRDGDDRMFIGSISQLVIGGRIYDLSEHIATHSLKACDFSSAYLKDNFPKAPTKDVSS